MTITKLLKNKLTVPLVAGLALLSTSIIGCKEIRRSSRGPFVEDASVFEKKHTPYQRHGKMFTPEYYYISFKGEWNFIVIGEKIYSQFEQGDEVKLSYYKVFEETYDDINSDGKKELVSRKLVDLVFEGAVKK